MTAPSLLRPEQFAATARLTVTCSHDRAEAAAADADWDRLYRESASTNPFLHPAWARAAAGQAAEPWHIRVHDAGALVAVAALELATVFPGTRVLRVAGAHRYSALLELPSLLVHPRYVRSATRAIVEYLMSRAGRWSWAQLPLSEHTAWFEPDWLPGGTGLVTERLVRAEVILALGDCARLRSRNLRESVRRSRNRLTRDFGAQWSIVRITDPVRLPSSVDNLIRLHHERSVLTGRKGHPDRLAVPALRAYLDQVAGMQQAGGPVLSCYELHAGGDVIAQLLALHAPAATYCGPSGFGAAAWPYSPTTMLQWQACEDARGEGCRSFSLSTGPDRAKLRWSSDVRIHPEFAVVAPRRGARIAYACYAQAAAASRLHRQFRG
ncbi:GNAT family N-acetyltransferase [Symbioplanes lichenis]|uniref:GNAT family N-acetyltransferase n=1 Tax=Symbioplanes lichenis TaxID=1629072 RepID=UPI002738AE28|nr:GNAT family N-acetyltransferase [Actinoplanes lichenis]